MAGEDAALGEMTESERNRILIFVGIQILFLVISPLAGGFHYKIWSMLDSSILVVSIGLTGLIFVAGSPKTRALLFKVAVGLYVLGVLDVAVNILLSGWLGWADG